MASEEQNDNIRAIESTSEPKPGLVTPDFPIVGIGASAGGLAAFEEFFSGIQPDSLPGMAFVLVQHLAPDHASILVELIRRYTTMTVLQVEDGIPVEPNHVYIIPPNHDIALEPIPKLIFDGKPDLFKILAIANTEEKDEREMQNSGGRFPHT